MTNNSEVSVQHQDFEHSNEYQALVADNKTDGAVVCFTGLVRDFNQGEQVLGLTLEHYPGMTEAALQKLAEEAANRWSLGRVRIIHRVGRLDLADQIVFVGVSSVHREAAFTACQFIMDQLKTRVPFWKKERTLSGERWVQSEVKDQQALTRWSRFD